MRTVNSTVQTAIGLSERRMFVRATFSNMRTYFSALTSSYPYADSWESVLPENSNDLTPYPSDIYYYSSADKIFTVMVGHDTTTEGAMIIKIMKEGSATATQITYLSAFLYTKSRPSVYGNYIFYKDPLTANIYRATINWDTYYNGGGTPKGDCITAVTTIGTAPLTNSHGAFHATGDAIVYYVHPNYGGLSIARYYYDGGWTSDVWDNAVMFPATLIGVRDYKNAYYSGAASAGTTFNSDAYIYITNPESGSVMGVRWDQDHSEYSQPWVAMQSDLSVFRVCNAFYANNMFMVAGQFARNGEYISHDPVAMILRSPDGRTLTNDQFTLLSKLGWRFVVRVTSEHVYGSDLNRIIRGHVGAALGGTATEITTLVASDTTNKDIISFRGTSGTGGADMLLELRGAAHEYEDDANIVRNVRCAVELGYMVAGDAIEWVDYETYIVVSAKASYRDGNYAFSVQGVQESFWRLATQVPPFYTEIAGKSGVCDELKDKTCLQNLYAAPEPVTLTENHFSLDFWGAESWVGVAPTDVPVNILDRGGVTEHIHSSAEAAYVYKSFMSADISAKLGSVDYPEATGDTVKIDLYGWQEVLVESVVTEIGSIVKAYVLIERGDTEMLLDTTLDTGYYATWYRTHPSYSTTNRSLPIRVVVDDIQIGDKIKKLCIRVGRDITSTKDYMWCIERAEFFENILVKYKVNETAAWQVLNEEDPSRDGLKLPAYGRYIMFTTKPAFAFNGAISASFSLSLGDNPSTAGVTAFGLILLAENASNCIIGRYSVQEDEWQILKMRDGVLTELASVSDTNVYDQVQMKFEHDGAKLIIYKGADAVLTHTWSEANGPMATATEDILHMGLYGEKTTASFRCTSFDSSMSDAICLLPGESTTDFTTNFPSGGGKVMIDGRIYTYTSRPTIDPDLTRIIGPYQARCVVQRSEWKSSYDAHTFPTGVYCDTRYFRWKNNYLIYDGCVLAADNGYAWEIDETAWSLDTPQTPTLPMRRSRHLGSEMNEYAVGMSNRMYITDGLRGILPPDQATYTHGWGTRVYLYGSEEIVCNWITAFSQADDLTVRDMVDIVTKTVGATATFSGDYTNSQLNLVADTQTDLYPT